MKTFVVGDVHGRCSQLEKLVEMLPRQDGDTLVFLGDLIDRGPDAPGCVDKVLHLHRDDPENVFSLRGNHEQMMLDFIDEGAGLWLTPVTGGEHTYEQYTETPLHIEIEEDIKKARVLLKERVPEEHIEFFRRMP
jgi:serine/threonine protein phosphatase 1